MKRNRKSSGIPPEPKCPCEAATSFLNHVLRTVTGNGTNSPLSRGPAAWVYFVIRRGRKLAIMFEVSRRNSARVRVEYHTGMGTGRVVLVGPCGDELRGEELTGQNNCSGHNLLGRFLLATDRGASEEVVLALAEAG